MRILFLVIVLCLPELAIGQCYETYPIIYAPYPYNQGTSVSLTDDTHSDTIDIGFDFCFFGDSVSILVISSNGYITFHDSLAGGSSPWSINDTVPDLSEQTTPTFAVMAPWQDINPGSGGSIHYSVYGTAPFRKFVVSYNRVAMFSCTSLEFTNQIILHESSNYIDIIIQDKPLCTTWNGGAAVEGIVNQDGTEAFIVPGRNFPEQWEAHHDAWRFIPVCECPSIAEPPPFFVSGVVYEDLNGNCEFDPIEPTIPNVLLNILPSDVDVWTNSNGEYTLQLDSGEHFIIQSPLNPPYLNYTCTGNYVPFELNASSSSEVVNLGDEVSETTDVSVSISSTNLANCESAIQTIEVCNMSTEPQTGLQVLITSLNPVMVYHPDSISEFEMVSDSILSLTIDSLGSFECREFELRGDVICLASNIGSNSCFTAEVEFVAGELHTVNNYSFVCQEIIEELVPSQKTVQSVQPAGNWIEVENIEAEDPLVYRVDFVNTGSIVIQNVSFTDTLSEYLNHSQVEVLASSHEYFMSYSNGVLTFDFGNINLLPLNSSFAESQLYIEFKVEQWPGNQVGTVIENTAYISVETSFPQPTNTTQNEIHDFSTIEEIGVNDVWIYPNPTTGKLLISNSNPRNRITSMEVLDLQGRLLISDNQSGISQVDLSKLRQGIYLIRLETEKGIVVKRVVRN